MVWNAAGTFHSRLSATALTANRKFVFPDRDGTFVVASAGVVEVDRLSASSVFATVLTATTAHINQLSSSLVVSLLGNINLLSSSGIVALRADINQVSASQVVATRVSAQDLVVMGTGQISALGVPVAGNPLSINASAVSVTGWFQAAQSITIGDGGQYTQGSIYSDASWGMILRARRSAPAAAVFSFNRADDVQLVTIANDGLVTLHDVGGMVISATNGLLVRNNTTIQGNAAVGGTLTVSGTTVLADLTVAGRISASAGNVLGIFSASAIVAARADINSMSMSGAAIGVLSSTTAHINNLSSSGIVATRADINNMSVSGAAIGVLSAPVAYVTIGQNGTYSPGTIYSDVNWGMILRAKQAAPSVAVFRFADAADNPLVLITAGGVNVVGGVYVQTTLTVSATAVCGTSLFKNGTQPVAAIDRQTFTTTGTWTKPTNIATGAIVIVEAWGGGGGGTGGTGVSTYGGGGGGYAKEIFPAGDLSASVAVTIGAGGAAGSGAGGPGGVGGNTTFGTYLTAFGGGGGQRTGTIGGGGGGGELSAGSTGGAPGLIGGGTGKDSSAGGEAVTIFGGGGGSGASSTRGGHAVYGGGGGASSGAGPASTSVYGGNGGAATVAGTAPGGAGGGGNGAGDNAGAGARGECRVTTIG